MDKISSLIKKEERRQRETITLIPSENYASQDVRGALSSSLSNKYSEGYPGRRYYQGNKIIDEIETEAIELAKRIFKVSHANVQPYSGSPANSEVLMALLNPGDIIMGMSLSAGGHLTHGHPKITFSGKFFNSIQYGVNKDGLPAQAGFIDYEEVEKLAKKHKPKLIIAGTTAYPRIIDWKRFSEIADSVGAYLMADISHISGLVAGGVHPTPADFAHIITTTTHKTLRGPRGAIIMVTKKGMEKDPELAKKIDRGVFPGMQGGPHNNQTAAIAIALAEVEKNNFKDYAGQIVKNAKILAEELIKYDFNLVTGGTDNHLILIDMRNKNISGKDAAQKLEDAGIITNYNAIPFDPNPPTNPSGLRIGTPAVTTRGMKEEEMKLIASWISQVLSSKYSVSSIKKQVKELCKKFPVK